jgi:tetratricopeptide (TPR) repeat protein
VATTVAVIGTAFVVPAFAQTAPAPAGGKAVSVYGTCGPKGPSPEDQEKAHTAYTLGKEKYDGRDLDAAIFFFKEAYAKDCSNHDYLIIISRAYERQNNLNEAILALQTYVTRAPSAPDVEKHKANIDSMTKERNKLAAAASASSAATTAPTAAPTAPPPKEQEHTVPPYLVTGLGVVALGVGIPLFIVGGNAPSGCSDGKCDNRYNNGDVNKGATGTFGAGPTGGPTGDAVACSTSPQFNGCSRSDYNLKRQQDAGTAGGLRTAGLVTAIGGGVLLVGGIVWHFVEPTGPVKKEGAVKDFQLVPVVAPGYSGLTMGARF